jgi:hypothetical protein
MIKPLIFHTENIRAPTTMAAVPQTSKVHRGSCPPPPPPPTACQPTHDSWPAEATAGGGEGGGHFGAFANFSDSGGRGQLPPTRLIGPFSLRKAEGEKICAVFFKV